MYKPTYTYKKGEIPIHLAYKQPHRDRLKVEFSTSKAYRENYDSIDWGKKKPEAVEQKQ